jgi:hypothetical protein
MFRLRQLDPIALEKIKSLNYVDEVEVLLAYQVGLREELQLPVQTHQMIFRRISGVSDQDLAAAGERVKAAEGGEALLEFFVDWQPWREYLQREYSSQFKQLETVLEMRNEQLTDLLTAAQDGQIEGEKILLDKYNEVPEVGKKLARALQIKLTLACLTPNVTLSTKFDPVGLPAKPALEELQWRNAIGKQIIEMGLPVANQEPEAQLWETLASHWNRAVQLTKSSQDMEWCQNYLEEIKSSAGVDKARIAGMLEALKRSNQQPGDD